ncbi:MAG: ubiquinol-cytochrome C chaperone [Hyphomicrobiaceae bacterium]|nr:ubiquinol-cytochrome C chaperone [Hyphomicrobiaceae bacterium]
MLAWLRARNANARKAKELYGAVVAAARQPVFYAGYGLPDTLNGRFEIVVLHLFLLLERLRGETGNVETVSRLTLEAFCTDMDDCMRELGVGDTVVAKRVKKAAAAFYERASAYGAAISENDGGGALASALARFMAEPGLAALSQTAHAGPAGQQGEQFVAQQDNAPEQLAKACAELSGYALRQRDLLAAERLENVLAGRIFQSAGH